MQQHKLKHRGKTSVHPEGFSLIEMLLAVAVFSMFAGGFLMSYIQGQQNMVVGGQRIRATYLAEEGLEAVRNIRDRNYANLVEGTYGLEIEDHEWVLSGESDLTDELFFRQILIRDITPDRKEIVSTVKWSHSIGRTARVQLLTHLTNWQR